MRRIDRGRDSDGDRDRDRDRADWREGSGLWLLR